MRMIFKLIIASQPDFHGVWMLGSELSCSAIILIISIMPVATPTQYAAMIDAAQKGNYAYPAVNVTSITTINAALKAFADAKSDGIIQVSTGGGQFAAGLNVKDAAFGAIVLAEATHLLAENMIFW